MGATALGLALAAPIALAQEAEPEESAGEAQARQRYIEGSEAYRRGDYEAARLAFAQAYAVAPMPAMLLNLGHAEFRTGRFVESARHLSQALREAELSRRDRATAEKTLKEAENSVGALTLHANVDGVTIAIDDQIVGVTPIAYTWYLEPGEHHLRASKAGYEAVEVTFGISRAQRKEHKVEMNHIAAQRPEARGSEQPAAVPDVTRDAGAQSRAVTTSWSTPKTVVVVIGASITGLAFASAGYFFFEEAGLIDDAKDIRMRLPSSSACLGPTEETIADCQKLSNTVADQRNAIESRNIMLVAGGIAAIGTVATWLLWPNETEQAALQLTPMWSDGGAGLLAAGRF